MALKYNNTEVENVLFNGQQVEVLKFNGTTVWENIKVIYLGEGTTFDVKSKFPKWANLNNSNFYITTSSTYSDTGWTPKQMIGYRSSDARSQLYKSYNASTGVLTCYVKYKVNYVDENGNSARNYDLNRNVKAYLITKAPIDLGTAKSFDVKSIYPNYSQLTVNDFYIRDVTTYSQSGFSARMVFEDRNNGVAKSEIVKSYNASTGVLTCYLKFQWTYTDSNGNGPFGFNQEQNCHVYLCDKVVR